MTKLIPALLFSTLLAATALASAHAEVPGEEEGLNAVMAALDKERAAHAMQATEPPLVGRAGVPLATSETNGQAHSGC